MNNVLTMLRSTVGLKVTMAVTGAGLVAFVVAHLMGNLLVFGGPDAIDTYAQALHAAPLPLWAARTVILTLFVVHVTVALVLRRMSFITRPTRYVVTNVVQATLPSRTMLLAGVLLFVYLSFHLAQFVFGAMFVRDADFADQKVYSMVVSSFQDRGIALTYVGALACLGLHLSHGIGSLLKSLGLNDKRYNVTVERLSYTLAALIFLGYAAIPLAVLTGVLKLPVSAIAGL